MNFLEHVVSISAVGGIKLQDKNYYFFLELFNQKNGVCFFALSYQVKFTFI